MFSNHFSLWTLKLSRIEAEKSKQRVAFEDEMKSMLALVFGGNVVFVKSLKDDAAATEVLKARSVIGLDCEWVPDFKPGADAPLSLVQICDGETCYLWLLFQFRGTPHGLHSLLTDESITKVGCGMRGSDLRKFARSKMPVCPGVPYKFKSGATNMKYELPKHFEDIQDYNQTLEKGRQAPYSGLDHLQAFYVRRRAPVAVKSTSTKWHLIEIRSKTQFYAITDAYAALLIYHIFHENLDLVRSLLARDDASMQAFITLHTSNSPNGNEKITQALSSIPPFTFDASSAHPEDVQRLYYLQRQFFAAREIVEVEELNIRSVRNGPQPPPSADPTHHAPRNQSQQMRNGGQRNNYRRSNAQNSNPYGSTSSAPPDQQMPSHPPPPSRQTTSIPQLNESTANKELSADKDVKIESANLSLSERFSQLEKDSQATSSANGPNSSHSAKNHRKRPGKRQRQAEQMNSSSRPSHGSDATQVPRNRQQQPSSLQNGSSSQTDSSSMASTGESSSASNSGQNSNHRRNGASNGRNHGNGNHNAHKKPFNRNKGGNKNHPKGLDGNPQNRTSTGNPQPHTSQNVSTAPAN